MYDTLRIESLTKFYFTGAPIPSKGNVADEATKSKKHSSFDSKSIWFSGSDFLGQSESHWPEEKIIPNTSEELRAHLLLHTTIEDWGVRKPLPWHIATT